MISLALDFSTTRGQIVLFDEQAILFHQMWLRQNSHAELVTPALEAALAWCKLKVEQIDRLCVVSGPGSFTGVRVAINTMRTLAYHLDKSVTTVTSLDLIALNVPVSSKTPLLVLMNAFGGEFFMATYKGTTKGWAATSKIIKVTLPELETKIKETHTCIGDGYNEGEKLFSKTLLKRLSKPDGIENFPDIRLIPRLLDNDKNNRTIGWIELEPLYLKKSAAEEKLCRGV